MTNLIITPDTITILVGEIISYDLYCSNELGTNTIASVEMTITDSNGSDVTSTHGGGTSNVDNIVTFGVKGIVVGTYTISFVITCAETLPDTTVEKFNPVITMVIE